MQPDYTEPDPEREGQDRYLAELEQEADADKQPAPRITYRDGRPAFNVKIHRAPTVEEYAEVAAELGIDPAALARPPAMHRKQRGTLQPFAPAWVDAYAERDPEGYGYTMGDAASFGFEHAREQARELFGSAADLFQEGRSGGWLVLSGPGLDRDTIEAAEAVEHEECRDCSGEGYRASNRDRACGRCLRTGRTLPGQKQPDPGGDEAESFRLLANLARFGDYIRSAVADHPRAQAWALAQVFQQCAEEYQNEQAEKAAEERLARARTAFEDAATRLRDAALAVTLHGPASPKFFGFTLDDLCPAIEALDAARLELEQAKGGAS